MPSTKANELLVSLYITWTIVKIFLIISYFLLRYTLIWIIQGYKSSENIIGTIRFTYFPEKTTGNTKILFQVNMFEVKIIQKKVFSFLRKIEKYISFFLPQELF